MQIAIEALDALGVALAGHNHVWTERERSLYEQAMAELSPALLPEGCFWITEDGKFRVARQTGEHNGLWVLDVFRNPDDAHADKAMERGRECRPA